MVLNQQSSHEKCQVKARFYSYMNMIGSNSQLVTGSFEMNLQDNIWCFKDDLHPWTKEEQAGLNEQQQTNGNTYRNFRTWQWPPTPSIMLTCRNYKDDSTSRINVEQTCCSICSRPWKVSMEQLMLWYFHLLCAEAHATWKTEGAVTATSACLPASLMIWLLAPVLASWCKGLEF